MLDFFRKLFGAEEVASRRQANDRLRVVLTNDRLGYSAELMDTLREEIIAVIAKHMEIEGSPEVKIISEGRHTALDISISLKKVEK